MAAWLIALINHGLRQPGGAAEGAALALTAFAYFRIVCTYESPERDRVRPARGLVQTTGR